MRWIFPHPFPPRPATRPGRSLRGAVLAGSCSLLLAATARAQYLGPWETTVPACREALTEAFRQETAGNTAAWLAAAEKAVAADPACGLAAVSRANALVASGEIEPGLEALKKRALAAQALPPHRVVRSDALAALHTARVQRKLGEPLDGSVWAADVVRLDPENRFDLWPEAFLEFRDCMVEEGRKGGRLPSSINGLLRTVLGIPIDLASHGSVGSSPLDNQVLASRQPPPPAIDKRYDPNPPAMTRVAEVSAGTESTHWSCLAPGPEGNTVWCFHLDEPKATVARGSPKAGVTVVPVAAPHPVAAAAPSAGRLWLAPAGRPELVEVKSDGTRVSTHRIRRPATSLAVCGRTGLVFYAAEGFLWSLDPATGENRRHAYQADMVAVDDLRMQVIAVTGGSDLGRLKENPFLKGVYQSSIAMYPMGRTPNGLSLRASYNEWGVVTLDWARFEDNMARVLAVSLGGLSDLPMVSTFRPLREWKKAGANLSRDAASGQMHGAWKSYEIEATATLSAKAVAFQQRGNTRHVHTETGSFGRTGAWSLDGGLFVCAGFDGHGYRNAVDQGSGLSGYQLKPRWLDEQFRKGLKKARESVGGDLAASRERRIAEWTARAAAPAATVPAPSAPAAADVKEAARSLRAAMQRFDTPARQPWPDAERYRDAEAAEVAALDRAFLRLVEGETGPALAAAAKVLQSRPAYAPALALRGAALGEAGDAAGATRDLQAVLAADGGATSLSPLAHHQLARLHLRAKADAAACASLASAFALGPPGPEVVGDANRLLARLGWPLPMPSARVPPIVLANAVPAKAALGRDVLQAQAVRGLVRVRNKGSDRISGPGLVVSAQGHILTYHRTVYPEGDEVVVEFLRLENGALRVEGAIPARWVRSDDEWNLALLQVDAMPEGTQPVALANRLPRNGEEVFLFSVPEGAAGAALPASRGVVLEPAGQIAGMAVLRHSADETDTENGAMLLSATGECLGMGVSLDGLDASGVAAQERYTTLEADGRAAQAHWLRRWLVEPRHLPKQIGRDFP